jgi:hypothetical protein
MISNAEPIRRRLGVIYVNRLSSSAIIRGVPDHDGGRPKQINAWFLYTHMVYL